MKRLIPALAIVGWAVLSSAQGFSHAQELAVPTYYCTTSEIAAHSCAKWGCPALFAYAPDTLLYVLGTTTGDRDQGSDQWLLVDDLFQDEPVYIHSAYAQVCEPESWQIKPVIPTVSETARAIYRRGLEMGNDPTHFSKVGDCQNVVDYYLAEFDFPPQYDLGPFAQLQSTIDQFSGSWSRVSAAVEGGYTVASVHSPLWANPELCETGETPLECEERLFNPSIVIISMETWNRDSFRPVSVYEEYLSRTVEFWIDQGVVPIVATKADNLEGDHSINAAITRVAETYDIPLWNFWLAAQSLPNHGLADHFHLKWARSFFNNPERLRDGWPVRNLTALQAIDAVWQAVSLPDGS